MELARQAERSLDLQTFVLHGDASGGVLLRALRDAAARGVRVRILVDDLHTDTSERLLSDLAAFERVEVRLVNPFVRLRGSRAAKLLSSLDELSRVNHRMHNKVFIADNALAIFGGRNVGDEYFLRAEDGNFLDLDVLAAGEAVLRLSDSFDAYWNSEFAWPIDAVVAPRGDRAARRTRFDEATSALVLPPCPPPPERLSRSPPLPRSCAAAHWCSSAPMPRWWPTRSTSSAARASAGGQARFAPSSATPAGTHGSRSTSSRPTSSPA